MRLGRKKKGKPSCGWNRSLSCSTKTSHFQSMQCPGLCLEQVCLLKYLTCHTCVSWTQSWGIILVPVHTSWSYPQRYPVTPRTGGAALHTTRGPRHVTFRRQTATPGLQLHSICARGAGSIQGRARDSSKSNDEALPSDGEQRAPRILFFPSSALTTSKFSTDLCQTDTLEISFN